MLTKDDILNKKDLKTKTVKVPEWGGDVKVSELSGYMRDQYELYSVNAKASDKRNIRAAYAAFTIVDENGDLMFTPEDIEKLGRKSGKALDRIFEAAEELNKLYSAVEDEAKKS